MAYQGGDDPRRAAVQEALVRAKSVAALLPGRADLGLLREQADKAFDEGDYPLALVLAIQIHESIARRSSPQNPR